MGRREDIALTVVVVALIMAANLVVPAKSRVNVEIKFRRFTNPGGRDKDGSYCEGVTSSCETFFKLCVKLSRSITTSFSGCDYQPSSSDYIKSNDINFQTQNTNIDRTIIVRRDQWDGYVSFYMEIWDYDIVTRNDRIDSYTYTHLYTPGINGSGIEEFRTLYGARTSYRTSLYFSVKVFCDMHFYGSNCNKFCIGRDDSSGHYVCNRNGNRVCYRNWYNLPNCLKYCTPHDDNINGHYLCASNGSRICRQNWYNLPYCNVYCEPRNDSFNGHFNCSRKGEKLCHPGWYGDNCTIFCLPRNNEHYNCSETGARICHKHWYGAFCIRFCKPNRDTINGFYNCSSIGGKLCRANYFGTNCTVFCKEAQNGTKRFVCDKRTGAKFCLENWTGRFCNISKIVSSSSHITQRLTSFSLPMSSFADFATVSSIETTLPLTTAISSVEMEQSFITVDSWTQASSGFIERTPSLVSALLTPLPSTTIITSLKQSGSYTSIYSRIHHISSSRSFQTSVAAEKTVSTLLRPSRSTTMITSLKQSVSYTSIYSRIHHISSSRSFQTSVAAVKTVSTLLRPSRSTTMITSLKQSVSYTSIYSRIHHISSSRSFQTSVAAVKTVSTLLRPSRSTTMITSLKQSVSYTSIYSKIHHISSSRSFQTSVAAKQPASKEDMTTATTAVLTTTTSNFIPSKSSSTYYKSSAIFTQRTITAKPDATADKGKSENGPKNLKWLLETKEGKTVLVGAIFAFLLLVGVIVLVVMYLRLPKKDNTRDFETLKETPDDWKSDEQSAKSYSNPLYKAPDESSGSKSKKKKSKLEKFYTKKDPTEEPTDNRVITLVSDVGGYDSDDNTGIYRNPLFGVGNQCYDSREETEI